MQHIREMLENRQIAFYFCTVVVAAVVALLTPGTSALEAAVNPALALMLFVTFLPVPLAELKRAFAQARFLGWFVGRMFRLDAPAGRSVAFSAATRNSLVVLPLAFAVPDAVPALPAIIVTQTLVELMSELVYVRLIPKLGSDITPVPARR